MVVWYEDAGLNVASCQGGSVTLLILRQKHTLVVVMRDNAGENKSKEFMEYFDSVGVRNHFSTAHEQ
jgi:hypothetical protein